MERQDQAELRRLLNAANERQLEREARDLQRGADEYLARVRAEPIYTGAAHDVLERAVRALADKIKLGRPGIKMGRNARAIGRVMQFLDPLKLAYMTVHAAAHVVLRASGQAPSLQTVIDDLGRVIVNNMGAGVAADGSAALWSFEGEEIKWEADERLRFAGMLLDLLAATGTFIQIEKPGGRYDQLRVSLLPEARNWLDAEHARQAFLRPLRNPMVALPLPWDDVSSAGGFLSTALKQPLIRVRGRQAQPPTAKSNVVSLHVEHAINELQRTSWQVNRAVLDVALQTIDCKAEAICDAAEKQRRTVLRQTLQVAEECRDEAEIYFPWQADYRGRMYPDSDVLNPERGGDLARGLLQFARAEPLGARGRFWLAVQIANCYGRGDECGRLATLEQRAAWMERNGARLREFMKEAKDPWQFLAAALEWEALLAHEKRGGSHETFESRIPVMLDGRANGVQHYAALTRSHAEGELIGIVPSDKPRDLYTGGCPGNC